MGLCNIECVEKIAQYLDVSPGNLEVSSKDIALVSKSNDSSSIQGFNTIVQALLRRSRYTNLLGNKKEVQALTQQWLEYITVCVNYADLPATAKRVFHELNTVLQDVTYIAGTTKTLADITLYYVLHSVMKQLSQQEKAQYTHLSRWFDNIQQEKKLRSELDVVSFELLYLFQ